MRPRRPSAVAALLLAASAATAQTDLTRPLRLVIPFPAGGPNDYVARILAPRLSEALGTPIVIDNRSGAGGNIGTALVAKAAPDGHSVVLVGLHFVANPALYAKPGYDPIKDFAPVTLAAVSPVVIVAHPGLPATNLRELVQHAKGAAVNYASPGTGTAGHLAGEMFTSATGVKLQHIPYKGAAPAMNDLLGGQVKLGFPSLPPATPHVRAGKLKAIAVTTLKRSAALPEVPTVAESGYAGFSVDNMYGLLTTAGTPRASIERLHGEVIKILRLPEVHERLASQGYDPVGNSSEEYARYLRAEIDQWARVIKAAGLRAD
ncbi:MAG: tripartite tricarboxylate transporter substrate binding protein [Burkholderiales bacterium]|nr:tripartite tricarboxylate transporter substrate binding protein [Burkholderiales bacterium]